jgi:hypothetical protein
VCSSDLEDAAYKYEKKLINEIGRHTLTNKTDGGKGAPAWVQADDAINSKEPLDKVSAKCIFMMMRKTAGFTRPPVIYLGGKFHDIEGINFEKFVTSLKKKMHYLYDAYGEDWLKREASKEKVSLSFI